MKIAHYDRYGNAFVKFDIIPNLKHVVNRSGLNHKAKKKMRFFLSKGHSCAICGVKA